MKNILVHIMVHISHSEYAIQAECCIGLETFPNVLFLIQNQHKAVL